MPRSPFSANPSAHQTPPCGVRWAFTLIELLVVISIIAVLLAIALPSLRQARESSRVVVCLSNLRQINLAAQTYHSDYDAFPSYGPSSIYNKNLRFSWGGVHWYPGQSRMPLGGPPAERPLNPYLGDSLVLESDQPVFHCPSDTGYVLTRSRNAPVFEDPQVQANSSRRGAESVYHATGSSYEINTWIFCSTDSQVGFGSTPIGAVSPNFRGNQGPQHVIVAPSRFALFGEASTFYPGRMSPQGRYFGNVPDGWWHGYEVGHLAMLDGSAIVVPAMRAPTTSRYTIYLDPNKQRFAITVLPERSYTEP